ncbi:hypothetical protein BS78_05G236700 [Paspalum vaginatum]|nr:hypothetical protein BS78_05G236700 [Paspalum vaginatum]
MNIKRSWQPWLLPLLTYLLFLTSKSQPINNEATNAGDLSALLSFKSLIRNDPKQALSSWDTGSKNTSIPALDFCQWAGVFCSDRHYPGRVTALHLRGFNLAGTISPQLSNLTHLQILDLSANNLYGEIPFGLTGCTKLYVMNLSTNFLSGSIPAAVGHLSKLTYFSVLHNNLTGDIPISVSNLTSLTIFSVESNYFDGKIPSCLGNLTSMETLDFSKNSFHGHIPAALGKMTKLGVLNMQDNQLEDFVPLEIFNISSIEQLDLGFNQLSGSLPPDIGFKLPKLKIFTIMVNKFEGPIPVSLSNASALEVIFFRVNKFSGQIPQDIGIHGHLTVFSIGYNHLQATEPKDWGFLASLTNCSNLTLLDLDRNNLVGVMPITIANLSKELTWISIASTKISGSIPAEIGTFHKLRNLTLADNLFIGTLPPEIGQLPSLQYIDLSHNRFHGQIPKSMGNITQLSSLSLSNNILDTSIPTSLGNLTNLRAMDLSCNLLSDQIPQEIFSIFTLTNVLNLSNNALSGSISPQIGHLNNLGIVDLSMNKLSGEIPEALSGCIELQFLYLQGNILQGKIPEGLNSLRGLQYLDLSDNRLAGPIPEFLESFTFLTHLNLSFNNLYGPVPNTGIFRNATILSLQGNSKLCGGPPLLQLPSCQSTGHHNASEYHQHVIMFCILGALILFICSTTAYCFIKRSKPNVVDEGNIFLNDKHERISYAELHAATESFSPAKLIGSGSSGNVYIGNLIIDENLITVAIKVLNLVQQGAKRSFLNECNALRRIRHRKLVKVITVCSGLDHNGDDFKALVLEFICNGTLDEWLHPNRTTHSLPFRRLSLMKRLYIALDVAEALEYLHHHIEPPIVHCDIKPSNILLDDDMVAHVTDFGLAKILHSEALERKNGGTESNPLVIKGTIGYVAPEYGSGSEVSTDGDIYSYGVLLLEMLTGRRPTESFTNNVTNLVNYSKLAYPNNLLGILDAGAINGREAQDITELLIYPMFRLALACCENSPRQRMKMGAVVEELNAIKKACTIPNPGHQLQAST